MVMGHTYESWILLTLTPTKLLMYKKFGHTVSHRDTSYLKGPVLVCRKTEATINITNA